MHHAVGPATAALIVGLPSIASAAVLAEDTFSVPPYTVGGLTGQNPSATPGSLSGFTGAWTEEFGSGFTVQNSDLAGAANTGAPGSAGATNGRAFHGLTSGASASSTFAGTIYLSFLFQLATDGAGYRTFELYNGGSRTLQVGSGADDFATAATTFGFRANDSNASRAVSTTTLNTSVNRFVVALDLSAASNSDNIRLFVNPTSLQGEAGNSFSEVTGIDFAGFDRIALASFSGDKLVTFDDVRFATIFADAIPEPSSVALLGLGFTAMTFTRRRR